uniref:Partial AB-hydrolase lipase domain-containing protein n=1 Tax=Pectinophora gossypiella TaxID=13191 RepID=A0A1E1WJ86_PECGO
MWSNSIVALLVCACAFSGQARQPPNVAFVEKYFGIDSSGHSRFSDNVFEDALLDVPDLIRKYGYPLETHEVVTEDGYILEMHRIPHGRDQNNQPDPNKPVVIVMHGLLCSSADFVIMGPGTALGYILAEAGYDVWLGNARGNFYSRRHLTLDPNDRRDLSFWNFSWDEIGQYDLPAMIDYTLSVTGKSRLHYIGHSQGTVVFWVMGALRPEYNEKIITMQAYAPVAYLEFNTNPFFHCHCASCEQSCETSKSARNRIPIISGRRTVGEWCRIVRGWL